MIADKCKLPKRKHPRLKDYDYSQNGCYFVTICTKNKRNILGEIVGRADLSPPELRLTEYGKVIDQLILSIPNHYDFVEIHHYVIMPNHIHILFVFNKDGGGLRSARPTSAGLTSAGSTSNGSTSAGSTSDGSTSARPTLHSIIHALKTLATKRIGFSIWQTGFHDHIIRDETDYLAHWQYIDNNPAKWTEDEYYID